MLSKLLATLLLFCGLFAGLQTWRLDGLQQGIAQRQMQSKEQARAIEHAAAKATKRVDRANVSRSRKSRAAVAADTAVADGVRNAIAAYTSSASATPGCADVEAARDRLAGLLAEGVGLVAEGRGRGQESADQVIGLQAYASTVPPLCGTAKPPDPESSQP